MQHDQSSETVLAGENAIFPVALTIAGSDSGGGAGIQADLRAFAFFGVFGTSAITAITAQNPHHVSDVHAVPPSVVNAQIKAVTDAFTVRSVKTGMLFSAEIIEVVAEALASMPFPLVIDPVVIATSGARLLREDAMDMLCTKLLPLASLITPNQPEAELLAGCSIQNLGQAVEAARLLSRRYKCSVLLKGGHITGHCSTDILCDGDKCWELSSAILEPPTTHGTGCTLSAAIAAGLAYGLGCLDAVIQAKAYVYGALRAAVQVGPATWAMTAPAELPLAEIMCRELQNCS